MCQIISVVNQKGGVGKTTTSVNLSAFLAEKFDKKVLLIDLDPQGNSTSGLGIEKSTLEYTIYDVLINDQDITKAIVDTRFKKMWICPTNINLAGAEIELVSALSRETILKRQIEDVKSEYDYIIIDCPPSLGLLTINALAASTGIIVPIQGEFYALEGLSQLIDTINIVKKHLNRKISILGVVITMYDTRTQLTKQVATEVKEFFGDKVFNTVIPRNIRLAEAPSYGKTILEYDRQSKGGRAYNDLAYELIKKTKEKQ